MKKNQISEDKIKSVKDIYKETRAYITAGKMKSDTFKTDRGVRQGCPVH
jgi:hypothetical protein